jgi:hypothetical protein
MILAQEVVLLSAWYGDYIIREEAPVDRYNLPEDWNSVCLLASSKIPSLVFKPNHYYVYINNNLTYKFEGGFIFHYYKNPNNVIEREALRPAIHNSAFDQENHLWRLATSEEIIRVQTLEIEHLESVGWVPGAHYKEAKGSHIYTITGVKSNPSSSEIDIYNTIRSPVLHISDCVLIKMPIVNIASFKVQFQENKITIGCQLFHVSDLLVLYKGLTKISNISIQEIVLTLPLQIGNEMEKDRKYTLSISYLKQILEYYYVL